MEESFSVCTVLSSFPCKQLMGRAGRQLSEHEDLSLNPQHPSKQWGIAARSYNPSMGGGGGNQGSLWGLAGLPA